ncbi:MAG: EAL domain-containing protein, partial [Frankiales bacterium]|nr:EAL domain-containing protein [Frankiales bacterium]
VLKIDREFVTALASDPAGAEPLVRAMLALAASFGLSVTAEGVEQQAQSDALMAMGCDRAQGWLYGRPLPAAGIDALLAGGGRIRALATAATPATSSRSRSGAWMPVT